MPSSRHRRHGGQYGHQALAVAVRYGLNRFVGKEVLKVLCQEASIGPSSAMCGLIAALFASSTKLPWLCQACRWGDPPGGHDDRRLMPVLFNALGADPAVASGPFITTVNDIVGLGILYLGDQVPRLSCLTRLPVSFTSAGQGIRPR